MAIPTVGAKDLHTVQLSPQIRKLLKERADAAAQREYAPILAADKQAFAAPKAEYQTQKGATEAAAGLTQSMLSQALKGLSSSGLSGRYLHQATNELTSRQGDAAESIPFLLAEAAENKAAGLGDARQQLAEHVGQMKSSAASDFNSALESERSKGATALKEQETLQRSKAKEAAEDAEANAPDPVSEGYQNAYRSALNLYKTFLTHAGQETESGNVIKPPKTDEEWATFAEGIADESDAAGEETAYQAVEELRKRLQALEHQGKLPARGSAVPQDE